MIDDDFNDFLDSDDDAFFVEASNTFLDSDIPSSEIPVTSKKYISQNQERTVASSYLENQKNKISTVENVDEIYTSRSISDVHESSEQVTKSVTSTSVELDSSNVICSANRSNVKQDAKFSSFNSGRVASSANKNICTQNLMPTEYNNNSGTSDADADNFISHTFSKPNSSNLVPGRDKNNFSPESSSIGSSSCILSSNKDNFTSSISTRSNSDILASIVDKSGFTPGTTSARTDSNVASNMEKSTCTANVSSYIHKRFTPGFIPKAKKRKFAGPAGLLELFDVLNEENSGISGSKKLTTMDDEFEPILSSQFSFEHLTLPSWQKLQTDVSSHAGLHSTAKYYSIQWVLHESSKKRLPKYMVVPVLCVLLKEIKYKESSIMPVFMDDTDEINGKIDAGVISKFEKYIIEGAAFILKNVTFLCNVLILKTDNLVSIYQPDGTENYFESLESALDTAEPLKPITDECLKQSRQNKKSSICTVPLSSDIPGYHETNCAVSKEILDERNIIIRELSVVKLASMDNLSPVKQTRNDAFLEDLSSEDSCMDEFDELLGNLDEKSFLEAL